MPSNILPVHLKQTFPPTIWIFTEGEGDDIMSRLPFEILSTLYQSLEKALSHERLIQVKKPQKEIMYEEISLIPTLSIKKVPLFFWFDQIPF